MAEYPPPPDECANCGAAIPPTARACPACGADERTGWRETSLYDGLDLPDATDEDGAKKPRRAGLAWYWVVTAIAAVVAALLFSLGSR